MKKLSEFKAANKKMFAKRFFRVTAGFSVFFFLLLLALPIWQLLPEIREQEAIPLHYNIHFGVDWYGSWWWVFTIPLVGIVILLLDFVLSGVLWGKDRVLSYLLWAAALMCELILFVAIVFVVLLNLTYI